MKFRNGMNAEISDRELASFEAVHARLQYWNDELVALDGVAMEGMMDSSLGRIVIGITDTVMGLVNTFTTNLTRFNKDLKRSELQEFCDSNMLKVSSIESVSYDQLMAKTFPVPSGMIVDYPTAVGHIGAIYDNLTAVALVNMAQIAFTNVFKSFSRGDTRANQQISNLLKMLENKMKECGPLISASDKDFSGKNTTVVKFTKLFPSMADMKKTRERMLSLDVYLQQGGKLNREMETISSALDGTVELITKNEDTVDRTFVESLAKAATVTAQLLEAYSQTAFRHMALEHNFILLINQAYAKK